MGKILPHGAVGASLPPCFTHHSHMGGMVGVIVVVVEQQQHMT